MLHENVIVCSKESQNNPSAPLITCNVNYWATKNMIRLHAVECSLNLIGEEEFDDWRGRDKTRCTFVFVGIYYISRNMLMLGPIHK